MLKHLGYDGAYHDENISVSVLLENPLEHGLDLATIVFSVTTRAKDGAASVPSMEDLTFYLMDEDNRLYNTRMVRAPYKLIYTDLKHEFLFQDLRLVFYYRPYERLEIIGLTCR